MNEFVLTGQEKLIFKLRELFSAAGYKRFRLSKFEDYDLYSGFKDFLVSEDIISFTDIGGSLKALKPDVTLSIVRSAKPVPGRTEKLFYDETIYRPSDGSFKEMMQCGLECIGDIDQSCVLEVLKLAAASLAEVSPDYVLSISQPDIITDAIRSLDLIPEKETELLKLIEQKNISCLKAFTDKLAEDGKDLGNIADLAFLCGAPDDVLGAVKALGLWNEKTGQLKGICDGMKDSGLTNGLRIDLSAGCTTKYYSGIVFKGYVSGVPKEVLSGGRYDALAARMGKNCGAIGFAVYLDALERAVDAAGETPEDGAADARMLRIALPKGRLGEKVYNMMAAAGYECPDAVSENRKLIFVNEEKGVSYFWVKPSDVAVYVERGAADLGVCGKDIIMEHSPAVYELLDLKTGICRMAVAAKADFEDDQGRPLTVATKFENIAAKYYASLGRDIDIIRLNGSIELAPLLGLSDVIVDIVETGTTLRENGLKEREKIADISARLIANKASYEFKGEAVARLTEALGKQV
ncbi:MAG: ATP phosphoribosyltransferase [Firmicutes bacterium]|nr:ATP phosphoribosyltransferase [Bacillota bacterium]